MQINNHTQGAHNQFISRQNHQNDQKEAIQEEAKKLNADKIVLNYTLTFQMSITNSKDNFLTQSAGANSLSASQDPSRLAQIINGLDYKKIGYEGKPLNELSQNELKDLVSKDGFFGVDQTSKRLSDFVLKGAGDDVEKLKQGREGIINGYKEAQRIWGGELPDISKETLNKALEAIDKAIAQTGGKALDVLA